MKTIEEKAKAYDEVVEKLSKLYRDYDSVSNLIDVKEEIENIFPELKESEDERIRKALIKLVKKAGEGYENVIDGVSIENAIAWLEKQAEHAKFRDSIQVGDKVTRNEDGVLVNLSQLKRAAKPAENKGEHDMGISEATKQELEDKLHEALEKETPESCNEFLEEQGEKTFDKIVEKARTEKQRVLLTETDGSANIDWDCRSLDDVKILLKCGLEFIRTIEANKQILTDNRFGGCSFCVPTRYDKGIKQGEQKPINKVKPKFKVGDCIRHKGRNESYKIVTIDDNYYFCENNHAWAIRSQNHFELVDQKPADTEKGAKGNDREIPNSVWSEEDEARFESCIKVLQTSDGYDTINAKWLKSLKDRVQPQQQEWSEKDERMFKNTIALIETLEDYNKAPNGFGDVKFWLKSLKDRYTWKPSDEQIKALANA